MFKYLVFVFALVLLAGCNTGSDALLPTFTPELAASATPSPSSLSPSATPPPLATMLPTLPVERVQATAVPPVAFVRFVQANPELALIDIYMGDAVVAARFRPGSYSNQAVAVPSGGVRLRIVPAGGVNSPNNALYEQEVVLEPRSTSVLYVYGTADNVFLQTFAQDLAPLPPNTARVSVIHAVPNAPAINVLASGEVIAQELGYGQLQGPLELPARDYEISFQTSAGTLYRTTQSLRDQKIYTIMMIGTAQTGSYDAVIFSQDATPQTLLRLVHAAPDTPAVRVFIDDQLVIENMEFQDVSPEWVAFPSGRYTVRVEGIASTSGAGALAESTVNLMPNTQANLLIYDRFVDLKVGVFAVDTQPTRTGIARISAIHALPTYGVIRTVLRNAILQQDAIGLIGSSSSEEYIPYPELNFGNATRDLEITVGAQRFDFLTNTFTDEFQPFFTSPEVTLQQGYSYTYIITGRRGEGSMLLETSVGLQTIASTPTDALGGELTTIRMVNMLRVPQVIDITIDEELAADDLDFGRTTQHRTIPIDKSVRIAVIRATDGALLHEGEYFAKGGQLLTLFVMGEEDDIQIFAADEQDAPLLPGNGRGRFINAMYRLGAITLNYVPVIERGENLLATPDDLPQDRGDSFDIGNQIPYGEYAFADFAPGGYELRINNAQNGIMQHREFIEIEANTLYDFVLLQSLDDFFVIVLERAAN